MHELAIASEVVRIALERSEEARVLRVVLEIGQLAGVEPAAIRFCFESVAAGTRAEGAQLDITEIPGSGSCRNCGRAVVLQQRHDPCAACASHDLDLRHGRELSVKELEVI